MTKKYFKLFANCIGVLGYNKAIICDLQRHKALVITHSIYNLIEDCKKLNIDSVLDYNQYDREDVLTNLEKLVELELGFWTENPDNFPEIKLNWESPELINNAIIEIDFNNLEDIEKFLGGIFSLKCKFLEIREYSSFTEDKLRFILNKCGKSQIRSINLFVKYINTEMYERLNTLLINYPKLSNIIIHSCIEVEYFSSNPRILKTKQAINDNSHCGNVGKQYFRNNIKFFTEAHNFNTCLNKKISLVNHGIIKNCPSMKKNFGNINEIMIDELITKKEFKGIWNISKDKINVCSDCEYRYICTDCRAFRDNEKDLFSRPSKCKYNPYIGKWSHEDGFRTLSECGVISNENEFSIDHDRIAEINKEIWEEE